MDNYYVYAAMDGETVCYVGSGKGSRSNHVNSGKSHSKLLNQHVFTKGPLSVVKIREQLSNNDSLRLEQGCIDLLEPLYNVAKKVTWRSEPTNSLPPWPDVKIEYDPLPCNYNGWQVFADEFFVEGSCEYCTAGDLESIANYEMNIVDKDKQSSVEFPSSRYTSLLPARTPFNWELT